MITPMLMSMYATNLAHNSAATLFGANQARMDLANSATGGESAGEVASLASMDKAMALQGAMAQTNLQAAWAMQEAAAKMKKKDAEQRQRMLDNGVLFRGCSDGKIR